MSAIGVEMATKLQTLATWRRRLGSLPVRVAAVGLLLLAIGDHGSTVSSRGIDPLEILNLQVKPNVIVVLDSSGSMQETVGGTDTRSGDHPRSKMFQAKQVLRQVIAENSSKVSFLFGQYTQDVFNPDDPSGPQGPASTAAAVSTTGTRLSNRGVVTSTTESSFRFRYVTNNLLSPSMTTTELTVNRQPPPVTGLNITASNEFIRFKERTKTTTTGIGRVYYDCFIRVPQGTYTLADADLIALAAQLTTSLQNGAYNANCTGYSVGGVTTSNAPGNSYTVTWDVTNRRFSLTRTGGSNRWQMDLASGAQTAGPALQLFNDSPNPHTGPTPTTINSTTFADTNWSSTAVITGTTFTGPASRGFQAFQEIRNTWNTLYFREGSVNCTVTVPVGFYATGESLATALTNAMNGCTGRSGTPNVYTVTYDVTDGDFTFDRTGGGGNSWRLLWSQATNSIRSVINAGTTSDTGDIGSGTFLTGDSIILLRRSSSSEITENVDVTVPPDGTLETLTTYHVVTGRLFNGETLLVTSDGTLCGLGTTGAAANPPYLNLQQVTACGGTSVGSPVVFTWAGGSFGSNSVSCAGFQVNVDLQSCENTGGQLALIQPNLENEIAVNASGVPLDYAESTDGTYFTLPTSRPGILSGIKADGSTPIANSLRDIRVGRQAAPPAATAPCTAQPCEFAGFGTSNTTGLWGAGQNTPAVTAIKTHTDPKERTIVLFVTDGDDTCAGGSGDENAKAAAFRAEQLYTRLDAAQVASSVQTFVVGFGSGASVNRLNWIAWGGSGLGQGLTGQPDVTNDGSKWTETNTNLQTLRNQCTTCEDAFVAPDAATLAAILRALIEQGASLGEFTAQASLTDLVFEYVGDVPGTFAGEAFTPDDPDTRYEASVPVLFRSTFELPGFKGQVRALTKDGATLNERWNAGQVLYNLVVNGPANNSTGTASCGDDGTAGSGLCTFASLTTKIQRKIYSTSRNGVFPVTMTNYFDTTWIRSDGNRVNLWPPDAAIDSAAGVAGTLDAALGIGSMVFVDLQGEFGACEGSVPAGHPCLDAAQQTGQARKEARQIILAYMAGAEFARDAAGDPLRTATGQILYRARSWVLADSTLAESALIPPPTRIGPDGGGFGQEYALLRDGVRNGSNVAADGLDVGFGLTQPDDDANKPTTGPDTRANLKPVMTVLYTPANDMLHAFRAGRSSSATTIACTRSATLDCGGEELWGFVPFDQLGKLRERLRPQSRSQHTYMMGASVRFADVFVPNAGTTGNFNGSTATRTVGGVTTAPLKGVWRRVLLVGRGIGGKYLTALDVTSPGPYTRDTKDTGSGSIVGPIVLWNRGNPDTEEGTSPGTAVNNSTDTAGYALMGETWSTPTISFVRKLPTTRKPCAGTSTAGQACVDQSGGGVEFVAFVGSGYGDGTEGTTFHTLDVLTGDVVATANVGSRSPAPTGAYANALVAAPSAFTPTEFSTTPPHPANSPATRVYIGDLHGRLWKFLTTRPGQAIQFADLGADQPVATPVALLAINSKPFIFVTTGNESRANPTTSGQFKNFAFRDDQLDTDFSSPATLASCGATDTLPCLFDKTFEPQFRGTVQPATVFGRDATGQLAGRVFYVGTRFVPPPPESTLSTRVPPYPCKSRFDSILFALGAESGLAAFDLNTSASQDEFTILDNSRIVGASVIVGPAGQGAMLNLDEGLAGTGAPANEPPAKGTRPPDPAGRPVFTSLLRQASTVCRQ
jgi:hypothetical protein